MTVEPIVSEDSIRYIIKNGDGKVEVPFYDYNTDPTNWGPIEKDIYLEFPDLTLNQVLKQLSNKTAPKAIELDYRFWSDDTKTAMVQYGSNSEDILYLQDFNYSGNTNIYIKTSDKDFFNISDLFKSVNYDGVPKDFYGPDCDFVASVFNDSINASSGDDKINGGAGDDLIYIGNGEDFIGSYEDNTDYKAKRGPFAKHGVYNGGEGDDRYVIEDYDSIMDNIQASPLGKAFITDNEGDDTIVYSRYDHTEIKFMINFTKDGKIENFSKYGYDMIALNDYELNQTESAIECWNNDGGSYISASKLLEIENYETKDGYYVDNTTLQSIAEQVASWLKSHNFDSVADMLKNSGNDLASNVTAVSNIINKTDGLWPQYS